MARVCRVCKSKYDKPINPMIPVCSIQCGFDLSQIKLKKDRETKHKQLKRVHKSNDRSFQLKKAQTTFNKYIRQRDATRPCISCNRFTKGKWNAGHYRGVGAHPELRFNELNCHKQCEHCNSFNSGKLIEYRINLKNKIGKKSLDWLEGPHEIQKLSIDDIKEIEIYYKDKLKELTNDN